MLVAQAAQAVERYTGEHIDMARIMDVTARLSASEQNVALIGMPGCGKPAWASNSQNCSTGRTSTSTAPLERRSA